MRFSWRRSLLAAAVSLTAAAAGLTVSGPAGAAVPQSWTFSVSGDPGDPLTQGGSWSYSSTDPTAERNPLEVGGGPEAVTATIGDDEGNVWYLSLGAPQGVPFQAGDSYQDVGPPVYGSTAAAMTMSNNTRRCDDSVGSFAIADASFGPYGYIERFDATFELRCGGATGSVRGSVHIANPPPAPALDVTFTVAPSGTISSSGVATFHGTATCTRDTIVYISGRVLQQQKKGEVGAEYYTSVACTPGQQVSWSGDTHAYSTKFDKGPANVTSEAYVHDDIYDADVTKRDTSVITLTR